jgi:predicted permease
MPAKLWSDLRYSLRSLTRSPGFTLAAVVTIALGIGVNTGIFTVLNGVLFRDLPAPDAQELVSIQQTVEGGEFTGTSGDGSFTLPGYRAYRDRAETLSGVLARSVPRETTLGGAAPQRIFGAIVSCDYFTVLEQPPVLGRGLATEDCTAGASPVVVLGHDIWTSAYQADPGVVGRTIELDRNRFTVVGIASEDTYGGTLLRTSYFAPLSTEPLLWPGQSRFEDDGHRWLYLIGRRADGTALGQVRAELTTIAAQIDQAEPGRSTTLTVERATPGGLPHELGGLATGGAIVLMTAFGLILLIACANIANLLLARGTARAREIGIRLSLGASRARIVRQLLTESVLISIAGGLAGSALALWSFQSLFALAVPSLVPPEVPGFVFDLDFSPDFRVLWYAFALTLATGIAFGLAPSLHVSKPDLNTVIKHDAGGAGGSRGGGRLRSALIGTQVAFSMVLMIATGLLLRGLQSTYTTDPGFEFRNVVHLSFGTDGAPDIVDRSLMNEIAALPGVESVASTMQTPLGEARMGTTIRLPGESEYEARTAELERVTEDYFSLLEIPILRGRAFTEAEISNALAEVGVQPVIVSATTARKLWGDEDPIGRTLLRWDPRGDVTSEVVGVVADAQLGALGRVEPHHVFEPGGPRGELLVRSGSDFATIASSLRALVLARDPSVAFRVLPLEGNLGYFRGVSAIVTTLSSGLGVLALVLASVGIYGVVAYSVTRRHREIGIRMALGAEPKNVLGLMLRRTMRPVVIGALIGLIAAVAVTRVLGVVLFGVSPADPIGLGGSALLVIGVALAAGVLAARPATRTEPTTALRYE